MSSDYNAEFIGFGVFANKQIIPGALIPYIGISCNAEEASKLSVQQDSHFIKIRDRKDGAIKGFRFPTNPNKQTIREMQCYAGLFIDWSVYMFDIFEKHTQTNTPEPGFINEPKNPDEQNAIMVPSLSTICFLSRVLSFYFLLFDDLFLNLFRPNMAF